jgi:hypothetical protein
MLRAIAKRVVSALLWVVPDALAARILPEGESFDPAAIPAIPPAPETPIRLFIGPANSAGQGWHWARAAEKHISGVGALAMAIEPVGGFAFPIDQPVPSGVYRWAPSWRRKQARAIARRYSHVILESGRPLFGDPLGRSFVEDVALLGRRKVSVALLFHGSDIRLPSRHVEHAHWSPFRGTTYELTAVLESQVTKVARALESLSLPIFVSTPDLLLDLPDAEWLPVVVDTAKWRTTLEPFVGDGPPVVAHAPSNEALKGSDLIDPVLVKLEREGLLRYERITHVPASEMPGIYRNADIVVDQLRLGIYGVAACEAMAAGRVVISHVGDFTRSHVANVTGLELPIVETTPDSFEKTLREVLSQPKRFAAVASNGPAFVERVHDGTRSAHVLSRFLGRDGDSVGQAQTSREHNRPAT